MKKFCIILTGLLCSMQLSAKAQTIADAEQIILNVSNKEMADGGRYAVTNARNYMNSQQSDGSWNDINYDDPAMASWDANNHWTRLDYMVKAFAGSQSSLKGNTSLYNHIVSGFNFWIKRNPVSKNWYHNRIEWPRNAGRLMCIMRHAPTLLPDSTEQQLCELIRIQGRPDDPIGEYGQGANKMMVATQWVYRSAIQGNLDDLNFALEQFFMPISISADTTSSRIGIQQDLGFLQHGTQVYMNGYGTTVLDAISMLLFIKNSTYETTYSDKLDLVSRFFRQSLLPGIRGGYFSYNTRGRGLAGPNALNAWTINNYTTNMAAVDTAYATVYNQARTRINGQNQPSFGITPYNRNFWNCDYMEHQRKGFNMDVRMVSTRTKRCESGSGDNMKGYFVSDGSTWFSQSGNEYEGTFAMWEWSFVPGTTTPNLSNAAVPKPGDFVSASEGETNFAGGVSDSVYGLATFHQLDTEHSLNTQANKSWFFFDNEVVCMGSGIRSTNSNVIHTTLEQCKLAATPQVENADASTKTLTTGTYQIDNPSWLLHGTTAYHFPSGGKLNVSNNTQSGKWTDISTWRSDTATYSQTMFRAWLDHGTLPKDERYIYVIVPATSSIAAAKQSLDSLEYVNNETVQAVYNKPLNIVQAVFHKAGELKLSDNIAVSAESPCAVMFRDVDKAEVPTFVADPTHTLNSVRIYAKFPALKAKQLDTSLPNGVDRGRTVATTINEQTPDSVFIAYTKFSIDDDRVRLNAGHSGYKLALNTEPADATPQKVSWTSSNDSVVSVSPDGSLIAIGGGKAIVRATTANGISDSCVVSVNSTLRSFAPYADAYVNSSATGSNYGTSDSLFVRKSNSLANYETYLRFTTQELRQYIADTAGVKVYLVLSLLDTDPAVASIAWNVYAVSGIRWQERGITWGNKPRPTTTSTLATVAGRDFSATSAADNVVSFDVSSYVLDQIAARKTGICFNIADNISEATGLSKAVFASKEAELSYLHPRLLVQLEEDEDFDHNQDGRINLPDAIIIVNKVNNGDNSDVKKFDHNKNNSVDLPDANIIVDKIINGEQ